MWRILLIFLCFFMLQGFATADSKHKSQNYRQNVKKIAKKAKSKPISNEQISAKYGEGKVFQADAESIKLSSMIFYGTPYKFGGIGSGGLDCSAFVQKVFKANGIDLPRDSRSQAKYGYKVSLYELKPGDLLFFRTYKNDVSHVGVYIGNGRMIHATTRGGEVLISNIDEPYYKKRFLFAKRIIESKENVNEDPVLKLILTESLEKEMD